MTTVDVPSLRCSQWARSAGLDPGGTAGTPDGFLVVDWPLPWPADVASVPALGEIVGLARGAGLRPQWRVPALGQPPRVTTYRRPAPGAFTCWARHEAGAGGGSAPELAAATASLLTIGPATPADGAGEVLVCTHGRRDVCCGSAGTALFAELTGSGPSVAGASVAGRPVRRTSHTGGHRFAPTVIVLPEGTAWAFADADLIRRVLTRTGPVTDLVAHYRGCTGLSSPAVQSVERAVLAEEGWPLFDAARRGIADGDGRVELTVTAPDGTERIWEAEVSPGRTLAVPDCGRPLDEAVKSETERVVRGLRQTG